MGKYEIVMDDGIVRIFLSGVHLKKDLDAIFSLINDMIHETGNNNFF